MKRLGAVVVVLLVLGLTASSAMAASNVVSESIPSAPVSKCLCCSGNVSLPKDIKVQELKGPVAYFIVAQKLSNEVLNFKHWSNVTIVSFDFRNARVRLVRVNRSTSEQVIIPVRVLIGEETQKGLLVHLRNSTNVYTLLAVQTGPDEIKGIYIQETLSGETVDHGTMIILLNKTLVQKYSPVIAQSKLVVPIDTFMKVCKWVVRHVCEDGFGWLIPCGFCWAAPLPPVGPAVCIVVCWYLRDKYSDIIKQVCKDTAEDICRKLIRAGVVIIE